MGISALNPYAKAVAAFVVSVAGLYLKLSTDGDGMTANDWTWTIIAALSTTAATYLVPNTPATPPAPAEPPSIMR